MDEFWGKDTWHLASKRQNVGGVHLVRVFQNRVDTGTAYDDVRNTLKRLNDLNPELAQRAKAVGMKDLSGLEIKPTETTGLRIPLGSGRTVITDHLLKKATYRGKEVQDIVGYINWLEDAFQRKALWMPKEDVLRWVEGAIAPHEKEEEGNTPIIVPPQKNRQKASARQVASHKQEFAKNLHNESMKGKSWKLITHAWSGNMEPDTLNHWINQLALYSPLHFSTQEQAVEKIEQFIDDLPDWSFSDRLSVGDRARVTSIIKNDVANAFAGWIGQPDPERSAKKLRAVWAKWTSTDRNLFDKETWSKPRTVLQNVDLGQDFSWSVDELRQLEIICNILCATLTSTADAVRHLVRLIHVHPEVPRTWIRDLLLHYGIPAKSKRLDKPKRLIDTLIEMGWIYIPRKHFSKHCRRFGLGTLLYKFLMVSLNEPGMHEADERSEAACMDLVSV